MRRSWPLLLLGACTPTSSGESTQPAPRVTASEPPPDGAEPTDPFPFGRCPDPSGPAPTQAGDQDQSSAFETGPGSVSISPFEQPNDESRVCGEVHRIDDEGNRVYRVVLAGSRPEEERAFRVGLPPDIPLPFGVGDPIAVTVRVRRIQIHQVIDAVITDAAGALLMAYSEDGDAAFAPGFGITTGTVVSSDRGQGRAATRNDRGMVFAYAGRTAHVAPRQWRRLDTPGGDFVLSGFAVEWTGGTPPPDASNYRVFTIVRLRPD